MTRSVMSSSEANGRDASDDGSGNDVSRGISPRIFYASSQRNFRAPVLTPGFARTAALHALRADKSREWRLFRIQDAAFAYCDARPGLGLRVWALEIDTGGRRRFITASYTTFWRTYSRILRRSSPAHFYEVIRESHAAKLYFDLEFLIKYNPQADGNAMTNSVISKCFALAGVNNPRWNKSCENWDDIGDVIVFDSTTEKKFSRHLIFTKLALHDNLQMGDFVCRVVQEMKDENRANVMVFKGSDNSTEVVQVPFVDLGVYTRNRCFRLVGSSKFGKPTRLIFPNRSGLRVSVSEEEFLQSLVCNVRHDQNLLGRARPTVYLSSDVRSSKRPRNSADVTSTINLDRYACSPYRRLDDYVRTVVQPHGGDIYGVTVTAASDTIMYAIKGGYKYCSNIGRHHKSNNVILVADLRFRLMSQKCFDPDCRGFRSNPWEIPQRVFEFGNSHTSADVGEEDDHVSDEVLLGVMDDFENKYGTSGEIDDSIDDITMLLAVDEALRNHCVTSTSAHV